MRRDRQHVNVQVAVIGVQDVSVAAHRPDTDAASVSVRIGGALLYMNDPFTVRRFAEVWAGVDQRATALPREVRTKPVTVPGAGEPTVVAHVDADAPARAHVLEVPGRPTRVLVMLGRLTLDVQDLPAFRTVSAAFREAQRVAEHAFLGGIPAHPDEPAKVAGRAFLSPVGSPYQAAVRERVLPEHHPSPRRPCVDRTGPTR